MWQRFTERARKVIFYAQEEAGRLGENYVSTEHLLLGLVRENDSVAARILDRLGISLARIRMDVERQVTHGDGRLGQDMQLTPRAKRVIDLAYDEARHLNNNYIGTEHMLLGLIREGEGLAGRVLSKLGADLERTRSEVTKLQDAPDSVAETGPPIPAVVSALDHEWAWLPIWKRLTTSSQSLMQRAQWTAQEAGAPAIGSVHILAAIVGTEGTRATSAVEAIFTESAEIRRHLRIPTTGSRRTILRALSPLAAIVLKAAEEEVDALGLAGVGVAHIALGLMATRRGLAYEAMVAAGVDIEEASERIRAGSVAASPKPDPERQAKISSFHEKLRNWKKSRE